MRVVLAPSCLLVVMLAIRLSTGLIVIGITAGRKGVMLGLWNIRGGMLWVGGDI